MTRYWTRVAVVAVGALVILGTAERVVAHPASTSTVAIDARAGVPLKVTLSADADALLAKLESPNATPAAPVANGADRAARLRAQATGLAAQIDLTSDNRAVPVTITQTDVDENGRATIHLVGEATAPGSTLTFRTGLIFGAYPLAVRQDAKREVVQWLEGSQVSPPIVLGASATSTALRGVRLGFTHIVPHGLDHILFVLGLFLLSARVRPLLIQVSAFTLAHSVTLGLSLYGIISLPAHIVEPLIALSVAYVGVENLITRRLHPWRVAVVFAFGLLHGLGFAEAIASLQLSRGDLLAMLLSFNVGVEAGQLAVLGMSAGLLWVATRWLTPQRHLILTTASSLIGAVGLVWTFQRLF